MQLAFNIAKRSSCSRLSVGTVITSLDYRYVYAVGYNGNASHLPNQCDHPKKVGQCGCLHSEENAIINCTVPRTTHKKVFITHAPCIMCAKRLTNLGGITDLYYAKPYRNTQGIDIFRFHYTKVHKLPIIEF